MNDKIYVGNGKLKQFKTGGSLIRFSFTDKDLETLRSYLRHGWVSINISERRTPSDKGVTHYAVVDTYQPAQRDPAIAQPNEQHPTPAREIPEKPNDPGLPF